MLFRSIKMLKVYNTLTRKKQEFVPQEPGKVGMYVCGVTPYNHPHIGNARPFVTWDVIKRYFRKKGFEVKHIQNFTDMDDKIIKAANTEGVDCSVISERYIKSYFETYPGIKTFLDGLVEDGRTKGYVTTMFGRRRPVPELSSSNFMQRSFGERVAMNAPIQGSAADIIKIAMIHVHDRLKEEGLKSKLILQVHDELLVETCKEEQQQVEKILKEEMLHAADLAVTLEVDMHAGNNWYEAK